MQNILFLLLLFFFFNKVAYAQKKITIAVMDLTGEGLSASETRIITSRLRTDLVNTNKFTVVEREKMKDILDEQGFQLSGCTSNECVVEAGKLLGVERIVAGEIGKIGKLFTLSIRMIDVETGEILRTATEDCKCAIEDVLTNSVKNVSQILSGQELLLKNYNTNKPENKDWKRYGLTSSEYESFNKSGLKIDEWRLNLYKYNEEKINPILNALFSGAVPGLGQSRIGSIRAYLYYSAEIAAILFGIGAFGTRIFGIYHQNLGGIIAVLNHVISALDAGIATVYYNIDLKKKYKLVNNLKINSRINLFSVSIIF